MQPRDLFDRAEAAADAIRGAIDEPPRVGVILGSGLGAFADRLDGANVLDYVGIPHFPAATVSGHAGKLVVGRIGTAVVGALQGRFHYYEGHDLETVTFPIRVLQRLNVRVLVLTAATGGVNPALRSGDIVAVTDHLNLIGQNPLRGANDERLGTRFPDMTEVYSPRLRQLATEEAKRLGFRLAQGVYAAMPGPSYETPAEVRMLQKLGADVVGMSTAPEAVVARHAGMEVLTLAFVANAAAGVTGQPISHEEVLAAGESAGPRLARLIEAVIRRLPAGGDLAQ
jgi:purine-nucleoside phosphorylase